MTSTLSGTLRAAQPGTPAPRERFMRLPEVQHVTGISRTHIYRLIAAGKFPKPVPLGTQSVAWLASEVDGWIQDTIAAARGAAQ